MREKIYSNISCLFWAVLKRNSAKFIEYDKNYCCNSNKNYCNESPRYCSAVSSLLLHAVNTVYNHFHKSNNLQYNMLVRCFTGTTDSATKHYFFMISLGHFGQKKKYVLGTSPTSLGYSWAEIRWNPAKFIKYDRN